MIRNFVRLLIRHELPQLTELRLVNIPRGTEPPLAPFPFAIHVVPFAGVPAFDQPTGRETKPFLLYKEEKHPPTISGEFTGLHE